MLGYNSVMPVCVATPMASMGLSRKRTATCPALEILTRSVAPDGSTVSTAQG